MPLPTWFQRISWTTWTDAAEPNPAQASPDHPTHTSKTPVVEYSRDQGKRGPDWMQNNVDPVLAVYFTPRSQDQVWKFVTEQNVAAYQLWFQRMLLKSELYKIHSVQQLSPEGLQAIADIAYQAQEEMGLKLQLLAILAHQYIEADSMMRGMHTTDWTAQMVARQNYAPSPEDLIPWIMDAWGLKPVPSGAA